jgi:hypothetical protein
MATYGVNHISQCPEIFKRQQQSRFRFHAHKLPSGVELQIQGYEGFCYNQLLDSTYSELELLRGYFIRDSLSIWYDYEGKRRRYYPDIFLPTERKLIEVKSWYTDGRTMLK